MKCWMMYCLVHELEEGYTSWSRDKVWENVLDDISDKIMHTVPLLKQQNKAYEIGMMQDHREWLIHLVAKTIFNSSCSS